ncbi:DNA polymerase III subunit chi [Acinetobacter qingfengensis]|uniref:Uncharacterized protein n=1 Tax=Acinetobacter qingfengensis TaxID=1262585 RepID=A0A1E7QZ03_9GAMM|nr:DNA polymerase III subunit chi [Acinetobacter qingfengensis]KAA8733155.1 DNA polymerase III subunit chi [Acinetobacter qingfengensis]OEY92305.1 hypothetical protein BJI46_06055 [Acinetobacter qingfengensis]
MFKISFYLIEKKPLRQADLACRLCQQIYQKHRIWILCADQQNSEKFDLQLWNSAPEQFIPHGIDQQFAPICISTQLPNPAFDVCMNFSGSPLNVTELSHTALHIIEIIGDNEQDKQSARENYKYYRELGYTPTVHKL